MNKKEVIWGIIGSLLIIFLTIFYGWKYKTSQIISIPTKPQTTTKLTTTKLTLEDVQKHNSPTDCWIIINNKVYDVTKYIELHPAPPSTITVFCGKESTQAYNTKGGRGINHSANANQLLINYYIGDLIK